MRKLSIWAKHHTTKARAVIVFLHFLLIALAVYTGYTLLEINLSVPLPLAYTTILLFFAAVFLYPPASQKNTRFSKKKLYTIRKGCDCMLAACSFIFVCFAASNYFDNNVSITNLPACAAVSTKGDRKPGAEEILASLAYRDKSSLTRSEKRILKAEFKHQLKVYVKAKILKDDETAAKAVFIFLSIIGAVGLTFLLGALACNISCNGSEAAAILVFLLGITAIVFLLVVVIRKIKSHHKRDTVFVKA